jgi:hypothetical protein
LIGAFLGRFYYNGYTLKSIAISAKCDCACTS